MDVSRVNETETAEAGGVARGAVATGDIPCDPGLCATCTLADARAGERFVVTNVDDDQARVTALRFGMAEGACVQCVTRIPAGPIVLRAGRQEIAVGRELAKRIGVRADSKPE
jgi:Fe2+ transport system protein FeoA